MALRGGIIITDSAEHAMAIAAGDERRKAEREAVESECLRRRNKERDNHNHIQDWSWRRCCMETVRLACVAYDAAPTKAA